MTGVFVNSSDTGTNPLYNDSDSDGYSDYVETNTGYWYSSGDTGTDPNRADTDGDGIVDGRETNTGVFVGDADTGTDPFNSDSDGDGYSDSYEVDTNYDPNSSDASPDGEVFIQTAVELSFQAADGGIYRIEATNAIGEESWMLLEGNIIGSGQMVYRLYSTRETLRRFYRIIRTD